MLEVDNEKIQVSIYRIERSLFGAISDSEIISRIVGHYNKKIGDDEKFLAQKLKTSVLGDMNIEIFYSVKKRTPKWRPFLQDIVDEESPLLLGNNQDASFIAFIGSQSNLFAISGGHGNFAVQDYVDQNFGMDIVTRLISKDEGVIKALQDRGFIGVVLGSTKFFRNGHKLADEDEFGKIYKFLQTDLNRSMLIDELGFTAEEVKREKAGCLAKASFLIQKSIDFESLLRILQQLTNILKRGSKFALNQVVMIPKRGERNKNLRIKLEETFADVLYSNCMSGGDADFDLTHSDFEKYLIAARYKISEGRNSYYDDTLNNLSRLLPVLRDNGMINLKNARKFYTSLLSVDIRSFDENGNQLTRGALRDHIHGEITYHGKSYFFIDGEWYQISPDFIDNLNKDLRDALQQVQDNGLLHIPMGSEYENAYNAKYIGQKDCLVLDKVTPQGIELCDILKKHGDTIYLLHIKRGFDNSIRELASQILIAARRLKQDKRTKYRYINALEERLKSLSSSGNEYSKRIASQPLPRGGLRQFFQHKKDDKIVFCFACNDNAVTERSISSPQLFDSNIAKYSLIQLKKEIAGLGFGFRVVQIARE